MRSITNEQFLFILQNSSIKPRLKRELRFKPAEISDWDNYELINVTDRSGDKGVLLIELGDSFYILPYELSLRITNTQTGRSTPIICDFCYTWQPGSNAARISFARDDSRTMTLLCCGDLKCSLHVRNKTNASISSRAQLREDMSPEQRINRLKSKLKNLVDELRAKPVDLN